MSNEDQVPLEEVLPTKPIDPSELELAMVNKDGQMGTPADIAAVFFQRNYPRIRHLLTSLSRRSLERAVLCAAAYPLVPENIKPRSKEENELAWVLEQMIGCKITMIEQMKLHKLNSIDELTKVDDNESLTKGVQENG